MAEPQVFWAGLPGPDFSLPRTALLFLRRGRFLGGAGAVESVAVLVAAVCGDLGPKPKNDPGNLDGFDSFDNSVRLVARSSLRSRPDLLRRDLRSGTRGLDVSATNQSFAGQNTGIL